MKIRFLTLDKKALVLFKFFPTFFFFSIETCTLYVMYADTNACIIYYLKDGVYTLYIYIPYSYNSLYFL